MSKTPNGFQCDHCGKLYKQETYFLKHRCDKMERAEILRSTTGLIAYDYYRKWLSTKRKANVNIDTFGNSKFFKQFVKFAKWVKRTKLHDVEGYLRFMNMKDFPPHMWVSHEVYQQYLEFIDKKWGAEDHAKNTLNFLIKFGGRIADDLDDKPENLARFALEEMTIQEISAFIPNRKLSPWILLNSKVFRRKYMNASPDSKAAIGRSMDIEYWKIKMANNKEDTEFIREVVERFDL